jgi:hypothetical protein
MRRGRRIKCVYLKPGLPYVPGYYAANEVKMADWVIQIERGFD